MKREIGYELLRKLKANPRLMRKVKIFAVVGLVGFLVAGALTIWAGIAAINYVASKTTGNLTAELRTLPRLQVLSCWGKTQSLMAVQPWLERPVVDNLINLKVACLEERPAVCEGHECNQMKQLIHTVEGKTI